MRVCHALYEPEPGGQATHVLAVVEALRGAGHDVTVISGPARQAWLDAVTATGAQALALPLTKRGSAAQVVGLARRLRALRPDIVHLHGQFAGTWGRVAARLARLPVVVYTPHAVFIGSQRLWPLYRRAERWLRRWCAAIVHVSHHDAALAQHYGWATPAQTVVIPNGVDVAALRQAAAGCRPDKGNARWVVQAGRLHAQKGPDVLLAAAQDVVVRHPEVFFLLAGDGPLHDDLQESARRWGIDHRVRLLGWRNDVPALLAAADVVALASRWEAMPYALLEAMALGRPCVATHVGGVPEVIQDGVHGRVVPAGDAQALATALVDMLNDPLQAARLGDAAAQHVADHYTLHRMQADTLALYRRLADGAWT